MALLRSALLLILVAVMFGCPGPKEPTQSARVYSGDDSVYGENDEDAVESDTREIGADRAPVFDTDDIAKERLSTREADADRRGRPNLNWEPVYFEFDKAALTEEAKLTLRDYGQIMIDNPNVKVLVEGHCDIRGTEEYNLALGERRAQQVKRYLMELGITPARIRTISYGELRPVDGAENESAWARNRRVSFTF